MKINKYSDKDTRKTKLSKGAKAGIAIGLSAVIALSTFVTLYVKNNSDIIETFSNDSSYEDVTYVDDSSYVLFEYERGQDKPVVSEFENKSANFSESDYIEFNNYLSSLEIKYDYENLYGIDKAFKVHNAANSGTEVIVKHSHDIRSGSELTADDIYNVVIKNNKKTLDPANPDASIFLVELDDNEIRKACEFIADFFNKESKRNSDIDMDKICCFLSNLSIVSDTLTRSHAYIDQYCNFIINPEMIKNYQELYPNINAYEQVMAHECMHIGQNACEDMEKSNEMEIGNSFSYENLDINPLYYSWLLESSAELEMSEALGVKPTTYYNMITYFNSLMLVGMLNENVNLDDIKGLTFDKNPNQLYELFGAKTNEEKVELVKLLYSIEVMQTMPQEFIDAYYNEYNKDLLIDSEEENDVILNLRISVLKSFTVKFYSGLANALTKGNLTLNDVYYLINIYESDVFLHLLYNEEERVEKSGNFFDFYVNIQDNFFNYLSKNTGYSSEDIIEGLENFSMYTYNNNGKEIKNFNISSLPIQEVEFIEQLQKDNYNTGIPTIRYMKNNYSNIIKK